MATSESTIEFITDQLEGVPNVRTRKMFGEYALYVGEKVVALVCNDELFVKITEEGKRFVGDRYREGFAYPGARASMRFDLDDIEDRQWLSELIRITEVSLPTPKPKKKRK